MRIAWVCPYVPAPDNTGGRIRIRRLADALSSHDIELFCRVTPDDPDPSSLDSRLDGPWSRVFAQREPGIVRGWPAPRLARAFPAEVRLALEAADRVCPFDVVVAEHCYSTFELPVLRHAPLVLDEHKVESDAWLDALRTDRKPGTLIEMVRWRAFERSSWRRADLVIARIPRDAERIGAVRGAACPAIPNGISMDRYRYIPPSQRAGNRILFLASQSSPDNVRAAEVLARKVLPIVRSHVPEASLTLAGRGPHVRVRALAGKHVLVTGTLAEVQSELESHAVCANALVSSGACNSIKTLEAIASGIPLVSTPSGCAGYELLHEEHCLLGNTPKQLADGIVAVLTARERFDPMASRAHGIAVRHGWPTYAARFADIIEATAERGRTRGPSARTAPPRPSR